MYERGYGTIALHLSILPQTTNPNPTPGGTIPRFFFLAYRSYTARS